MRAFKILAMVMLTTILALFAWNRLTQSSPRKMAQLEPQQQLQSTEAQTRGSLSQTSDLNPPKEAAKDAVSSSISGIGGSISNPTAALPQTKGPAKSGKGNRAPKEPLKDPLARAALACVGFDPMAEEYWLGAINDANLSAHERQDLIEDLNEEGFDDPKNLTVEDLPLILSRIEIIEQLGPLAMDKVNDDAFQEAYKDLLKMADKVIGGSQL